MNRAMVAGGWAHAQVDAAAYGNDEDEARTQRLGLWRNSGTTGF